MPLITLPNGAAVLAHPALAVPGDIAVIKAIVPPLRASDDFVLPYDGEAIRVLFDWPSRPGIAGMTSRLWVPAHQLALVFRPATVVVVPLRGVPELS